MTVFVPGSDPSTLSDTLVAPLLADESVVSTEALLPEQTEAQALSGAPDPLQPGDRAEMPDDGDKSALDLVDLAPRAVSMPLALSFGQPASLWTAPLAQATGIHSGLNADSGTFAASSYGDCACPMCGGGAVDSEAVAAFWAGDGAPTTTGTITQLANYLRVDYWDDIGTRDPRQFDLSAGANNGVLRYDLTGWTGTLTLDSGSTAADTNGIASLTHRNLIRDAFDWYGQVLGVTFEEVESGANPAAGTVDFFFTDAAAGYNNRSATATGTGGNIDFNVINISSSNVAANALYSTILHEIGHGLGLGHQGPYNNSATFGVDAEFLNDSYQLSNMSYFSVNANPNVTGSNVRSVTMQIADLHALNQIYSGQGYGPYANAFNGSTTYGVGTNVTAAQSRFINELTTHAATNLFTLVDADGTDTVDFSNFTADQNINLTVISSSATSGVYSSVGGLTNNMAIAVGTIIENAETGDGNDTLTGNQYANELIGNGGTDLMYGGSGLDSLDGGDGNDTLYGGSGDDTLKGGAGDDLIHAESGSDYSKGGAGNDVIYAGSGVDTIQGDAGDDRIIITTAATLTGAAFYGGTETDALVVDGAGIYDLRNSTLSGFEEIEFSFDGANIDKSVYITGAQAVGLGAGGRIDGSSASGADDRLYIYLAASETTTLDMSGWIMESWVQSGDQVDFLGVYGGAAAESVTGTSRDDYVTGGSGNDTLSGFNGADTLYGGFGADVLDGGIGNDTLYGGDSNDTVQGGTGNDWLQGDAGNDRLYAGTGTDTVYGGVGLDSLYGDSAASTSVFYGGDSSDYLYKASGTLGGTSETWDGGDGTDWLFWTNSTIGSSRVVNLATGFITSAGNNRDTLVSIENVLLENGAGVIGDGNANWLQATGAFDNDMDGGAGNDTLKGGAGNDTLRGGLGVDYLQGEDGDDTLYDGDDLVGADSLFGGLGSDLLVKESSTTPGIFTNWDGGDGIDTFDWIFGAGIDGDWVVDLSIGRVTYQAQVRDILSDIENVIVRNGAGIVGDAGANVLTAVGDFANSIRGGDGNDTIDGGEGNDSLEGEAGDDLVIAGIGDDSLWGNDGADTLNGGTGADIMYGGLDNDALDGWTGDDLLYGDAGDDTIMGFDGNDTIYGGLGLDSVYGEGGDDLFVIASGEGLDNIYGGSETDTVDYSATAWKLNIDLGAGTYSSGANTRTMQGVENVRTGSNTDTITGSAGVNVIYSGAGHDVIHSGGGSDQLYGESGNDLIHAQDGGETLYGGLGNDTLFGSATWTAATVFSGGDGTRDAVDFSLVSAGVTLDIQAGTWQSGALSGTLDTIEYAVGSGLADILRGNGAWNRISGGAENDLIDGRGGNDTLYGQDGDDTVLGNSGDDRMFGGSGNDSVNGGDGLDTMFGDGGNDMMVGAAGDDELYGGGNNDTLMGGIGNDLLDGGAGTDRLLAGFGVDTLTGGAGVDTFVWGATGEIGLGATSDRILDFVSGSDKIDLSGIGGLSFIGTTAFSNTAGELRYYSLGGVGYLAGDTSGNGIANFEIALINGAVVAAGDLILI